MSTSPAFHAHTDASTVAAAFPASIKDRIPLITGVSNGGIGGATAKALAPHSPRLLILAGRSSEKVNAVIRDIAATHSSVPCRFLSLDLFIESSIRSAAATVRGYPEPLHVLINNAAVMNLPQRTLTPEKGEGEERIEMQFQTNHIGPFLLTNLLLPKVISTAAAGAGVRIIKLSSSAHALSPIRFSDLSFAHPNDSLPKSERFPTAVLEQLGLLIYDGNYVPAAAYGQSKTAGILFTVALNARLARYGVQSFAVHPGSIQTELQRHADQEVLEEARRRHGSGVVRKTLEQGGSTTLVAVLDSDLVTGEVEVGYMADCAFAEPAEWCRGLKGREDAERLWRVSEALVGEGFEW
ncbi:MAG: hypothetical protein LQ338_006173 [Usnochroma carphineum]|nr:MAG: hypothetical protein LQ338_006173 [Usnochroma carphineum]